LKILSYKISLMFFIVVYLSTYIQIYAFGKNDSLVTITISAVGDLMCHSPQYEYAKAGKDSFNFNPVYREVFKYFRQSDFVFGNLETVTAGVSRRYSGYPFFNTPDEYITALKNAGFNLLTTANNHSLDKGETGLLRTIEQLKENNLHYNGTFNSQRDRDSIRIFDIKGIKIAFLAYTYGTNGIPIPKGKSYLINMIDFNLIESDIKTAKENGAEAVLVHYHFGQEYKREPDAYQKEVVDKTISFGADIIIGGHPHVIQPVDYFKTKSGKLDSGFVAYSLGNFISNQRWRYSDAGVILNIVLTKNLVTNEINISDVTYIPTWVFKGTTNRGNEYVIMPLLPDHKSSNNDYLSPADLNSMKEAFNDTYEILTRYTKEINLYKFRPMILADVEPKPLEMMKSQNSKVKSQKIFETKTFEF
jgi:poly-gamma-glutamate capsule biosynthesis protein CapA/YwtB (metallophosphatase superfamily)